MRDDSLPLMIGVTSDAIPNLIWGPGASFNAGGTPLFPLNAAVLFRPLAGSSRRVTDVRLVKTERDAELLIAGLDACAPVAVDAVVERLRLVLPDPWPVDACERVGRAIERMAKQRLLRTRPSLPADVVVRCPSLFPLLPVRELLEPAVWNVARLDVRLRALEAADPDVFENAMGRAGVVELLREHRPRILLRSYLRAAQKHRREIIDLVTAEPALFDEIPSRLVLQAEFWQVARPADREKALRSSPDAIEIVRSRPEVAAFLGSLSWTIQLGVYARDSESFLPELLGLARQISDSRFWQRLPRAAIVTPAFWALAPEAIKLELVTSTSLTAQELGANPQIAQWATSAIQSGVIPATALPEIVRRLPELREWWSPNWQVDDAWRTDPGAAQTWARMSNDARLLLLFRAAKHQIGLLDKLLPYRDEATSASVRFVLDLLAAARAGNSRNQAFTAAHEAFLDHIGSRAFDSVEPIEVNGLLPFCPERLVNHCEGRPMPDETGASGTTAFCPRGRGPCKPYRSHSPNWHGLYGARLRPRRDLPWSEWTLLEVLETLGLSDAPVKLLGFRPEEYVQKLGGWINRLNEIRDSLRCSSCESVMQANAAYAKNLARYNATVMSCKRGPGHDQDVYLNHCWGCSALIDSRKARVRVEGFYLCLKCGTGPQHSSQYKPGAICPSCSSHDVTQGVKESTCSSCGHCFVPHRVSRAGPA